MPTRSTPVPPLPPLPLPHACREQARLWSQQSIAVLVHGAALGNWAFLPHNAAAVQIVTRPAGVVHDNDFAIQLTRDLSGVTNLTYFPANNLDMHQAHLRGEVVFKQPEWQSLKPKQKVRACSQL